MKAIPKLKNPYIVIGLFAAVTIVLAVSTGYFYIQYKRARDTQATQILSADELVRRVSKHILLPKEENPTLLTVSDKTRLSGQPFFNNAENGNMVLIYEQAKKAFLYDVEKDLVLEVGPVTFNPTDGAPTATEVAGVQATASSQKKATYPYTFAIYNGTKIPGFARQYSETLIDSLPGAEVVIRKDAQREYTQSFIIDITNQYIQEGNDIAKLLGIARSPMPEGEATPSADFLIVLGSE